MPATSVHELRLVVTVDDIDAAIHLYRDVLGMPELDEVVSGGHGRIVILEAGRATLELADAAHAAWVDEVEVGHTVDGSVRIALGVDDISTATDAVAATGAAGIAPPTPTPWGSRNSRFRDHNGLQLTLFG
jgi:lactoylglutathione lyase